jgi:hypothetical protein
MGSLIEELETREAAARVRVEELEAKIAELASWLEGEREAWSRLRIARETVADVIAEISGDEAAAVPTSRDPDPEAVAEPVRVVGAMVVPHWQEGLAADVLPDVYRDIVEVVADASGPMQAKQIVPRIGLPAQRSRGRGAS